MLNLNLVRVKAKSRDAAQQSAAGLARGIAAELGKFFPHRNAYDAGANQFDPGLQEETNRGRLGAPRSHSS